MTEVNGDLSDGILQRRDNMRLETQTRNSYDFFTALLASNVDKSGKVWRRGCPKQGSQKIFMING